MEMLQIKKQKEPVELVRFRATPNARYDGMDAGCKSALKKALLREQGFVCAYCMSRIGEENCTVEHWMPQSLDPKLDLDFGNMLAVCRRENVAKSEQTCDVAKNGYRLKFNPAQDGDRLQIFYNFHSGEIHSKDKDFDGQLSSILNLNIAFLKNNRLAVLNGVRRGLKKVPESRLVEKYRADISVNREFKEYCGIAYSYLSKRKR